MASSSSAAPSFTVVTYNLCEMRSSELLPCTHKLTLDQRPTKIASEVLTYSAGQCPDFMAVQELQYDMVAVPDSSHESTGENLGRFLRIFGELKPSLKEGLDDFDARTAFAPGNAGFYARKGADSKWLDERLPCDKLLRAVADPFHSHAQFPGQYGTGFWSRYKIKNFTLISQLRWVDFNPGVNLESYKADDGQSLPDSLPLFDKCFMHMEVEIAGKAVHFIVLHAIPPEGVPDSPNEARNADQLAFLSWYLTGKSRTEVPRGLKDDSGEYIQPLKPKSHFVAMGDWGVDYRLEKGAGPKTLQRLVKRYSVFPEGETTHSGLRGKNEVFYAQHDYLLYSKTLKLEKSMLGRINPDTLSTHSPLSASFTFA